ncbi:MAG: response regulator [Steroidobacteraceae bacterium]
MSAPKALIVDDNALNVELVSVVLQADSFLVESAGDAVGGLQRIQSFQPDLILMDVQLPGMDGLEFARIIKREPGTRHIVVIAFTAYAMRGDEARMLAAGCDGYLSKPIDVATFAAQVRAFLPRRD